MKKRLTIIGAGIPGLALAVDCLQEFGRQNLVVDIWDAAAKPSQNSRGDQRTTAFLPPSTEYLDRLGIWPSVRDLAAPLCTLRLVDDRGERHSAPLIETFDALEFGVEAFAQNVANAALRNTLIKAAEDLGAQCRWGHQVTGDAIDRADTGLVIGADGQRSIVRRHLGIELDQRTPPQTAIVCTATHALDQEAVSTEFHRDAGPFTLVPAQPDAKGRQRTAIVWVEAPTQAKALQALPAEAFSKALQENARGLLGRVYETTQPIAIPVATQQSVSLGKPGILLMAEAAHALPPIGAQGLNLSMADAIALGRLLKQSDDWMSADLLGAYEQERGGDIGLRLNATDALNRVTTWQSWLRDPITYGALGVLKHVKPIRDAVVRKGLGI